MARVDVHKDKELGSDGMSVLIYVQYHFKIHTHLQLLSHLFIKLCVFMKCSLTGMTQATLILLDLRN